MNKGILSLPVKYLLLLPVFFLGSIVVYGSFHALYAAPGAPSSLTQKTQATLPTATTYYYQVTAATQNGETTAAAAASVTTSGSDAKNTVSWNAVPGAQFYNVYRGVGSSTMTQYLQTTSTNIVDDGNKTWYNFPANSALSTFIPATAFPLVNGIEEAATVQVNGYIYVIGGYSNGSAVTSVYYAKVGDDGALGAWNATASLGSGTYLESAAAYNGYIYVIGGSGSSSVYYGQVNNDGTITSWTATSPLGTATGSASALAYNGYLYLMGGFAGGVAVSSNYYAVINSDGTIGTWTSTHPLLSSEENGVAVVDNGFVYYIGGDNGTGTYTNSVQITNAKLDGTLATWSTSSVYVSPLPIGESGMVGAVDGNTVIIAGGYTGVSQTGRVYTATINTDTGALSTWNTNSVTVIGAQYATGAVYKNFMFFIGGYQSGSGSTTSEVLESQVSIPVSGGNLQSSYTTSATNAPDSVVGAGVIAYNGYMYMVGGTTNNTSTANGVKSVYYAKINEDGSLGSWILSADQLPAARAYAGVAADDGYLYVIDGTPGDTSTTTTTVYYTTVNGDGSISAWSTNATAFPVSASDISALVRNTTLYVTGLGTANVYTGAINTNGSITAFTNSTVSLPVSLSSVSLTTISNHLYVTGGLHAGSAVNTLYYAKFNGDGSLNTFSTASATIGTAVYGASTIIYNGDLYVYGGYTGSAQSSAVYYISIDGTGNPGTSFTATTSLPTALSYGSAVTYNGEIYYVSGTNDGTNGSSTIYYSTQDDPVAVPASNTATTDTNAFILNWGAVTSAAGYNVYRSSSSGTELIMATAGSGNQQLNFIDNGQSYTYTVYSAGSVTTPVISSITDNPVGGTIPSGTVYYYKIAAENGTNRSPYSSEVSVTANATIGVPANVQVVTATDSGTAITSGSWTGNQTIYFGAGMTEGVSDTLHLLVEVQPDGTSFTNSTSTFTTSGYGVYESPGYTYTSGTVTASLAITLPSNIKYHWQAAVLGDTGGASTWTGNGGAPDFGIDAQSPQITTFDPSEPAPAAFGWQGSPTSQLTDGFESGAILTPSGQWTSDGGSATPTVITSTGGIVHGGSYALHMSTAASGTSYIENNGFTGASPDTKLTSSLHIYFNSFHFNTTTDTITLETMYSGSTTITSLLLVNTTTGPVIETYNNTTSVYTVGTTRIRTGQWYDFLFSVKTASGGGYLKTYINGNPETALSGNTGSLGVKRIDLGATAVSSNVTVDMYLDDIQFASIGTFSITANASETPYVSQVLNQELDGINPGVSSGLSSYTLYFGLNAQTTPSTSNATNIYTSGTLTNPGYYYLDFLTTSATGYTSQAYVAFIYNMIPASPSSTAYAPTSLAQYQSNGTTAIPNGSWTSYGTSGNNIVFSMSMYSPNSSDTLTPAVEIEPNGTAFTGTPNYTGSSVAFSGTAVTGTVAVNALTNCTGYHWQAIVENSIGNSASTVFNTTTPNFSVTSTAPTTTTVYDGSTGGSETSSDGSITSMSGNWSSFTAGCSGFGTNPYQVKIGTSPGGSDVLAYTASGITTGSPNIFTNSSTLPFHTGITYYITVEATNNAGLSASATSSGQSISPSLTFSIDSASVSLGNWNASNSYTTTATNTLTALTDAYNGYNIFAAESGVLTSNTGDTIADFSAGSYASPASWPGGTYGFGYTSSCPGIGGANKFSSGTLYAPFNHTGPGDIVAQSQNAPITGSNYTGTADTWTITYKAAVPSTQSSGTYQNQILYTIVASF